jgi:D-alanyl-D-alanine carboxypeptidase
VLRYGLNNPKINTELLQSFSVANTSGTLKKRNFHKDLIFRGKTGSLDGVSTIAGLLVSKSGKQLVLVALQNQVRDEILAKKWEEKLIDNIWRDY